MSQDFKIDPEFASLLPVKPDDEYNRLAVQIELEGAAPGSLVVADIPAQGRCLLDGHNTYSICQEKNLPVPPPRIVKLPNRAAAIEWIVDNQLMRRNLTDEQRAYFIGKKYLNEKSHQGGSRSKCQSDTLVSDNDGGKSDTSEKIAAETGTSMRTVKRNAEFAKAVDAIGQKCPEAKAAILNGTAGVSKQQVIETPLPSLFCDRCKGTGPVKDCEQCAQLRRKASRTARTKKATKKVPRRPRNGRAVFDLKPYRTALGTLTRQVNALYAAYGRAEADGTIRGDLAYHSMRQLLDDFEKQFRNRHAELTKASEE
jgi:hypothetical protein